MRAIKFTCRKGLGWCARASVVAIIAIGATIPGPAWGAEKLYPAALLNWMIEGRFHALVVDKSQQRLTVWRILDGEPRAVESYPCSTGENEGDKWVRGDMRTPEGVYFFCSVIDGRRLPSKYGLWAFTSDYPNFVDKRRGKNGDGIWLHGRDKPLGPKPDSNGCIAMENEDLVKVSRFIRLQSTPLIVVKRVRMVPRSEILEEERDLRAFIESWRQAWESMDLDRYMSHYSKNFQSCWLDYRLWREKKQRLINRYDNIRVRLGKIYLYRQNGLVTAIFTQTYQSDSYRATGIKLLYLIRNRKGEDKVYAEDYRHLADDPYPVAQLLARVGAPAEPDPEPDAGSDYRIRLVSTDEPTETASEDNETPRPSAPSRGVNVERIASADTAISKPIPLKSTEPNSEISDSERLIVHHIVAAPTSSQPDPVKLARRTRDPARVALPEPKPEPKPQLKPEPAPENLFPARTHADGDSGPKSSGPKVATVAPSLPVEDEFDDASQAETRTRSTDTDESVPDAHDKKTRLQEVKEFLDTWEKAWEQKKLDTFLKMYHAKFRAGSLDLAKLRDSKKHFFRKYRTIHVEIDRVAVRKAEQGLAVKFLQTFRGDDYRDKGWKTMVLAEGKGGESYRILTEDWTAVEIHSDASDSKASK